MALIGSSSSASNRTYNYDYSQQIADYGSLDGNEGQIIDLTGIRDSAINLNLLDQGVIEQAFGFASYAVDESTGLANTAILNANQQTVNMRSVLLFAGAALVAVVGVVYLGSK